MKNIISAFFAAVLALSLVACGSSDDPLSREENSTDIPPSQTEALEGSDTDEPPQTASDAVMPTFQKTATITETVLVDECDVRITATELSYSDYSAELALTIENNSEKDLSFTSNTVGYGCNSVNGYMVKDGYLNCDVAAGKKANDTISISYDTLMLYGIFEIADMEVGFNISDSDYNHIYSGVGQVKTSASDGYDYDMPSYRENIVSEAAQNTYHYTVPYFSDEILHDQDGFAVVSSGLMINREGEEALLLEVENSSAEPVTVITSGICLNGLSINSSAWSYDTINPGKTSVVNLALSGMLNSSHWDAYGIKDVGTVSLTMHFQNTDGKDVSAPAAISIVNPNGTPSFDKEGQEVYHANDIRFVMKGVVREAAEGGGDMDILLLVENNRTDRISLREVYDSFSANGYMMDCTMSSAAMEGGACAAFVIGLRETDLEENKIAGPDDLGEIEFSVSIEDEHGYEIEEATVNINHVQ